jgi:starch synthase
LDFSNPYAHRIEAGSDLFLMPSEYEPCGLNQMYSMAYGTIPVVRRTGGLADSVIHANTETINKQIATGFSFADYTAEALNQTLHQAIDVYHHQRNVWHQMMINGMKTDWSWGASAKKYVALYEKTIKLRSSTVDS